MLLLNKRQHNERVIAHIQIIRIIEKTIKKSWLCTLANYADTNDHTVSNNMKQKQP